MNGPDERLDAPADPAFEEIRSEVYSLRTMLSFSLLCLILLSFTMDRYLWKQVRNVRQQIEGVNNLEKRAQPGVDQASKFWNSLVAYSKTHPDFVPVIAYFSPALSQTMINSPPPPKQ
jgi:hypothetical protein